MREQAFDGPPASAFIVQLQQSFLEPFALAHHDLLYKYHPLE